jgi:hemerythrin
MALMAWTQKLSVGVARIDKEHQGLIDLLNHLHDEMLKGKAKDVLAPVLDKLIQYTNSHFVNEETLFRIHNYGNATAHKAEHDSFRNKAADLQKATKAGTAGISTEVMVFLKDWLVKHIQGTDMQYRAFFEAKGVK